MAWQGNPDASGARSVSRAGDIVITHGDASLEPADWPDERLMNAVIAHEEAAFAVLYDRYADLVYSTTLRILGDRQLAEDATQDIFVRLWRRPEQFIAERGRFLSWFMSVVRNRAVDELRARGRRLRREAGSSLTDCDDDALASVAAPGADPMIEAELHEEQARVRHALCSLPLDQRRALEMAYFGGLTQQEIALALHEPLGTVKTRIRLGMQKLRRNLEGRTRG